MTTVNAVSTIVQLERTSTDFSTASDDTSLIVIDPLPYGSLFSISVSRLAGSRNGVTFVEGEPARDAGDGETIDASAFPFDVLFFYHDDLASWLDRSASPQPIWGESFLSTSTHLRRQWRVAPGGVDGSSLPSFAAVVDFSCRVGHCPRVGDSLNVSLSASFAAGPSLSRPCDSRVLNPGAGQFAYQVLAGRRFVGVVTGGVSFVQAYILSPQAFADFQAGGNFAIAAIVDADASVQAFVAPGDDYVLVLRSKAGAGQVSATVCEGQSVVLADLPQLPTQPPETQVLPQGGAIDVLHGGPGLVRLGWYDRAWFNVTGPARLTVRNLRVTATHPYGDDMSWPVPSDGAIDVYHVRPEHLTDDSLPAAGTVAPTGPTSYVVALTQPSLGTGDSYDVVDLVLHEAVTTTFILDNSCVGPGPGAACPRDVAIVDVAFDDISVAGGGSLEDATALVGVCGDRLVRSYRGQFGQVQLQRDVLSWFRVDGADTVRAYVLSGPAYAAFRSGGSGFVIAKTVSLNVTQTFVAPDGDHRLVVYAVGSDVEAAISYRLGQTAVQVSCEAALAPPTPAPPTPEPPGTSYPGPSLPQGSTDGTVAISWGSYAYFGPLPSPGRFTVAGVRGTLPFDVYWMTSSQFAAYAAPGCSAFEYRTRYSALNVTSASSAPVDAADDIVTTVGEEWFLVLDNTCCGAGGACPLDGQQLTVRWDVLDWRPAETAALAADLDAVPCGTRVVQNLLAHHGHYFFEGLAEFEVGYARFTVDAAVQASSGVPVSVNVRGFFFNRAQYAAFLDSYALDAVATVNPSTEGSALLLPDGEGDAELHFVVLVSADPSLGTVRATISYQLGEDATSAGSCDGLPTPAPTARATPAPTTSPPTQAPTPQPTLRPTRQPTRAPTAPPSPSPTPAPTTSVDLGDGNNTGGDTLDTSDTSTLAASSTTGSLSSDVSTRDTSTGGGDKPNLAGEDAASDGDVGSLLVYLLIPLICVVLCIIVALLLVRRRNRRRAPAAAAPPPPTVTVVSPSSSSSTAAVDVAEGGSRSAGAVRRSAGSKARKGRMSSARSAAASSGGSNAGSRLHMRLSPRHGGSSSGTSSPRHSRVLSPRTPRSRASSSAMQGSEYGLNIIATPRGSAVQHADAPPDSFQF